MTADVSPATTATVMVIDDHPVVRDGVGLLLRDEPSLSVLDGAESGRAGLAAAAAACPNVVLLDLRLPDMLAPEVIRGMRARCPSARVVIFTAHRDHEGLRAALEAGAHGCLLKDAGTTDLVSALHRVLAGKKVVEPRVMPGSDVPESALARSGLTRREYDVLRLAAQGRTNPEIAEALGLTRNTVKTYLQAALHKLGARNRVDAISKANEARLL